MNEINKNQNTDEILLFLFAARKYYNKADKNKYIIWILTLLSFCVSNFKVLDNYLGIKSALVLILAISSLILGMVIENHIELGATIKELIDRKLFGFPINERNLGFRKPAFLKEKAEEMRDKYKKEYDLQIINTGNDKIRGVKDWYLDVSQLKTEDAILKCQKENTYWDKKLTNVYINVLIVFIFIVILILFFFNRNISLVNLYINVSSAVPLVIMIFNEFRLYYKFKFLNIDIVKDLEYLEKYELADKDKLEGLQMKIYKRRGINFGAPNIIHWLTSHKLHKIRNRFIGG